MAEDSIPSLSPSELWFLRGVRGGAEYGAVPGSERLIEARLLEVTATGRCGLTWSGDNLMDSLDSVEASSGRPVKQIVIGPGEAPEDTSPLRVLMEEIEG